MMSVGGADVALAAVICGTLGMTLIAIVKIIATRSASRHDALPGGSAGDIDLRLQRLEQAIDAIAIEVERMSESQRFTANVLAERLPPGKSMPSPIQRS